ncbi:Spy/CpxP family protein refolding chaperone [Sulfuricystis multivorans]|uniref:Spy/CpxP family protein refolding chaperone n=1 Tax=Sulfuricystis multivorans TaxID=2211108 RepID=UPI000F82DFCF|nr:Spy/CpxP family protein refolding chaperone [Sulfuricystis multivorans]
MKRTQQYFLGLVLAAGLGTAAFAQPGLGMMSGEDGMGPMGKMGRPAAMRFDPAARVKERLDYQKYHLKITPEQEALWNAFAEKVQAEAGKGINEMRALVADTKLTAPERMAKREALMEERLAAMKEVHQSFNRLYEALTPEQKAIADREAARMGKGPMGGRHGRMAPPQG